MTVPPDLVHASRDFDRLLEDVRDECMLQTRHQAYHTLRAVLHVLRNHLETGEAMALAGVLPPLTSVVFLEGYRADNDVQPFGDLAALNREVAAIRKDHNLAPQTAITDCARVLRHHCDEIRLDQALANLPKPAAWFFGLETVE